RDAGGRRGRAFERASQRLADLIGRRPAVARGAGGREPAIAVGAVELAYLRARRQQIDPQTLPQAAGVDRSVDDGARERGCIGHPARYVVAARQRRGATCAADAVWWCSRLPARPPRWPPQIPGRESP